MTENGIKQEAYLGGEGGGCGDGGAGGGFGFGGGGGGLGEAMLGSSRKSQCDAPYAVGLEDSWSCAEEHCGRAESHWYGLRSHSENPKAESKMLLHRYLTTASRPLRHAIADPMPSTRGEAALRRTSSSVETVRVRKPWLFHSAMMDGGRSRGGVTSTFLNATPPPHCTFGSVLQGWSRKTGKSRRRYMPARNCLSAELVTYTQLRRLRFTHALSSMSSSPRSSALTTRLLILNRS